MSEATAPVLVGAAVLAIGGAVTVSLVEIGPLSLQMLQHLALMNIVAPVIAVSMCRIGAPMARTTILAPGLLQLFALWAWHAPASQQLVSVSGIAQAALMAALGVVAIWFWRAVVAAADWRALGALLLTGKFACLLGALLIFAPRDLYALPGLVLALCATGPSSLADQQLAGLLMITACPLSYLVTGVALAARMLARLDNAPHAADATARAC